MLYVNFDLFFKGRHVTIDQKLHASDRRLDRPVNSQENMSKLTEEEMLLIENKLKEWRKSNVEGEKEDTEELPIENPEVERIASKNLYFLTKFEDFNHPICKGNRMSELSTFTPFFRNLEYVNLALIMKKLRVM